MTSVPNILVVLLALAFGGLVSTRARAGSDLPVIQAHADTEFAVYKGDIVTVQVKAKGDHLQYKWMESKNTFCREASCDIDTSDWGLGTHKISFVVFNAKGSLYLKFRIKVLAAPAGYKPGRVAPEVKGVSEGIETVTSDDLAVQTMTGRGFSYHKKKLQVVGPAPRTLDWAEKLKTQDESTMQILRADKEHHVLGPSTSVSLAKSDSGRRVLVLNQGTLRSRQLDGKDPHWSIVFASWLQIDTDGLGDVIVSRPDESGEQIALYVVRGSARVFRRRASETKGENDVYGVAGEAIMVPQGGYVLLNREFSTPPRIEAPLSKSIAPIIAATTPLYLPGHVIAKEGPGTGVLGDRKLTDLGEATAVALDAVVRRDFPTAIEALQRVAGKVSKDYRAALALGAAYKGLLLDKEAAEYLAAAARAKKSAPDPWFLLGEMELQARHWKKALTYLEKAEDLDYRDQQVLSYYMGVANFHMKEYAAARNDLTRSTWRDGSEAVAAAADAFRRQVTNDGWFDVRTGLGLVYDSNILRVGDRHGVPLPQSIKTIKGGGYEGHAGFGLWAYRGDTGHAGLTFDAERRGWLEPTLKKVETTTQEIALRLGVATVSSQEREREFGLGLTAFANTVAIGELRALDTVGSRVEMDVPPLGGLVLRAGTSTGLDPLPGRDDILDPTLGEIVEASERSNHRVTYGVSIAAVRLEKLKVGLGVDSGATVMRSALRTEQNFSEMAVAIGAEYAPGPRTTVKVDMKYLTRTFAQAADKRKDKAVGTGVGWRWFYTTSLYHDVGVRVERQASNRDAAAYSRVFGGYYLNFDL